MKNQVNNGNNQLVEAIIQAYLKVSETSPKDLDKHAKTLTDLILRTFSHELKSNQTFSLPYKDITDIVLYSDQYLLSDSIENFRNNIQKAVLEYHSLKSSESDSEETEQHMKQFMYIHDKLVQHILLAQVQREYIKSVTKDAQNLANTARKTATTAQETANKAEDTYKSMFANYVTILGIFTAIIVTIFGGLNVINVVMEYNERSLSLLVILISIIFLCLSTLLYFLANIVTWIANSRETSLTLIFGTIAVVCIIVIITSLFTLNGFVTETSTSCLFQKDSRS